MRSDREYSRDKPIGRHRIVVLGDSNTAGHGLESSERFSDLLENAYPNLDVMNFGLPGSGTDQQLLIYEEIAKRFGADAFIFAPTTHNILRNLLSLYPMGQRTQTGGVADVQTRYWSKPYFTLNSEGLELHNQPVPNEILSEADATKLVSKEAQLRAKYEKVYGLMPRWLRKTSFLELLIRKTQYASQISEYESNSSWLLMKSILERFREDVDPKPVFFVPLPTYRVFGRGTSSAYLNRFAELHDPSRNSFVVDVLPYFMRLSRDDRLRRITYISDYIHYSALGNRIIADAISDAIAKECPQILN